MTKFIVRKVAVLGAGVMGAQIAAHCINARVPVILFDLPAKEGPKNGIVQRAIANLKKLSPAPLGNPADADLIRAANYEDDLALLGDCDLVIEAISERLDWKQDLYRKVAPHIGATTIFASNTSGLSIASLATGLDARLKGRFCGVHFFNPPRYMHLVELIPTVDTESAILDRLEEFLVTTLGKGVVRALDTPNFIANRVGVFGMLSIMHQAATFDLPFDVVDELTGAKLGRAKSGTFRTADVVGLDTMAHVINTMRDQLPDDPFHGLYATPPVLQALIDKGALGQKTGAGFYRKQGKEIQRLDPARADYVASGGKADDIIVRILKEKNPARKMQALHESSNPQAQFLWAIYRDMFQYIAVHLKDIAVTARDVDFALRWGFGWNAGPFEIWQQAGWQQVATWIKEDIDAGRALSPTPLPDWVFDGRTGVHESTGSYSPASSKIVARNVLPVYDRQLFRASLAGETSVVAETAGETVFENDDVRCWHQGDDVLILSFKTKMHIMNQGVITGLVRATEEAEKNYRGLVIWQTNAAEGGPFSAGADLQSMLPLFMSGGVEAIEPFVAELQQAFQRIKYAQIPVIAAVAGLALGGGCELLLHTARRVVALESYIGLVEVGVGLIPAGGGLKEMTLRAAEASNGGDILPFLKKPFEQIAMATVSRSAIEARSLGYLRRDDVIVFNAYELLHIAKAQALALHSGGYRPPLQTPVKVCGRDGLATIRAQLVNLREGGFASAHDQHLATLIAEVMCGDLDADTEVTEQWLFDQERKRFIALLSHPKTQERVMGMLQTGKPVRN